MKSTILYIAFLAFAIVGLSSIYIVDEKEQVIVLQFGKPITGSISDAGLYFKIPLIHVVERMDKRILELRQQIDNLDEEIIQLLKKRMGISKEVGKLKERLDIPVEDKTRENEIIDRLTQQAGRNLSEEQLIRIFTAVFKSSKQVQK